MRIFIAALLLSACGISDNALMTELNDNQLTALCEEFETVTFTCGEGEMSFEFSIGGDCDSTESDEDSEFPPDCTATAGDYRACIGAYASAVPEEVCAGSVPEACAGLFDASCF